MQSNLHFINRNVDYGMIASGMMSHVFTRLACPVGKRHALLSASGRDVLYVKDAVFGVPVSHGLSDPWVGFLGQTERREHVHSVTDEKLDLVFTRPAVGHRLGLHPRPTKGFHPIF